MRVSLTLLLVAAACAAVAAVEPERYLASLSDADLLLSSDFAALNIGEQLGGYRSQMPLHHSSVSWNIAPQQLQHSSSLAQQQRLAYPLQQQQQQTIPLQYSQQLQHSQQLQQPIIQMQQPSWQARQQIAQPLVSQHRFAAAPQLQQYPVTAQEQYGVALPVFHRGVSSEQKSQLPTQHELQLPIVQQRPLAQQKQHEQQLPAKLEVPIVQQQKQHQQVAPKLAVPKVELQQPIASQKQHGEQQVAPAEQREQKLSVPVAKQEEQKPLEKKKHHQQQQQQQVEQKLQVPIVKQQQPAEQQKQHNQAEVKLSMPAAPLTCPAIEYTQKLSCSETACAVHLLSLTPSQPLDWVDVHVKSQAPGMLAAIGADAAHLQQPSIHLRMGLAAGPQGKMHKMMGMAEESKVEVLGIAHADAQKLLASSGASQIFSVQLPITFAHGDKLGVSFTYCANGLDCDTAEQHFQLQEDKLKHKPLAESGSKQHSSIGQQQPELKLAQPELKQELKQEQQQEQQLEQPSSEPQLKEQTPLNIKLGEAQGEEAMQKPKESAVKQSEQEESSKQAEN